MNRVKTGSTVPVRGFHGRTGGFRFLDIFFLQIFGFLKEPDQIKYRSPVKPVEPAGSVRFLKPWSDALPYLRWLDVGGYEKSMKKTAKELDHMAQGWLEEHKQRKISGGIKEHQDFLDVMLSIVTDEDEISSYDADTIIKATCLVRLFIYF